jgi:hypothetical protein
MSPRTLARLMARRSIGGWLEQRRNERAARFSRLSVAISFVVAQRRAGDWAWLDQDKALHAP